MNYINYDNVVDMQNVVMGEYITTRTLVGAYSKKYPYKHGNCFSMKCDNGQSYRIVNFVYENLTEAINRGIELPVRVLPLNDSVAVICDTRIPNNWYRRDFCTTCCPESLLPLPQRLGIQLELDCGARVNRVCDRSDGGGTYVIVKCDSSKLPDIRTQAEKDEETERLRKAGFILV